MFKSRLARGYAAKYCTMRCYGVALRLFSEALASGELESVLAALLAKSRETVKRQEALQSCRTTTIF